MLLFTGPEAKRKVLFPTAQKFFSYQVIAVEEQHSFGNEVTEERAFKCLN